MLLLVPAKLSRQIALVGYVNIVDYPKYIETWKYRIEHKISQSCATFWWWYWSTKNQPLPLYFSHIPHCCL